MTSYVGLKVPDKLREWSWDAKSILYSFEDAEKIAKETGVEVYYLTGKKGIIGAVAAIGCFDLGVKAAGVPEDFE